MAWKLGICLATAWTNVGGSAGLSSSSSRKKVWSCCIGGGWSGCFCQAIAGGIGNGAAFGAKVVAGAQEAGFVAGATCKGDASCNAGAARSIGTDVAGKLGGWSELTWHVADAAIVSIAGGMVKTGGPDAGVLAILDEAGALDMLEGLGPPGDRVTIHFQASGKSIIRLNLPANGRWARSIP